MAERTASRGREPGLRSLRRPGEVTELLLLYEITVHRHTRLRSVADALGVSVQAASLLLRELSQEGLTDLVAGAYHPTVRGIDRLHGALTSLREDLDGRLGRLQVVRRTQAVATNPLRAGQRVVLTMERGLLHARPGVRGSSRGRVLRSARAGDLVEVDELQGIVPLRPARVRCVVIPSRPGPPARLRARVERELRTFPGGLVGAEGVEAYHLLERSSKAPVTRFGVAAAAREAAQMGVPALVLVSEDRLPGFLQRLAEPTAVVDVELVSVNPE